MLKKLFFCLILLQTCLQAEIVEIQQIDEIRPYVTTQNALCLFDVDDTLIENPIELGTPPWRNWVRSKLPSHMNFALFDGLTLFIAQRAPYVAMEPTTAQLIADLQDGGVTALAFTARGRSEWYTTTVEGVDRFTEQQLQLAGIDFSKTAVPEQFKNIDHTYFYHGIIFAKHIAKGDLINILFKDLHYRPRLVIFVDDKLEQVKSVEAAFKEANIPFVGFWYRRSEQEHKHFNPMAANIQLEFLFGNRILKDHEARELAKIYKGIDAGVYLNDVVLRAANLDEFRLVIP